MPRLAIAVASLGLFAAPCSAKTEELRDFCADRPGMGTPACIVDTGHIMVEFGALDWTRDKTGAGQADSVVGGQVLLRAGINKRLELQAGWDGYASQRLRDPLGTVSKVSGGGDLLLGFKWNLARPNGSGVSLAVQPYVTLPIGKGGIGAGTWSAGLIVPASVDLGHGFEATLSPQILAEPNSAGKGRHLAFGGVAGLGVQLSARLSASGELAWTRSDDPAGASCATIGGLSLAWMAGSNLQIDGGANLHLAGTTPDREVYFGISRRF